ncbi:zinc-finger protein [Savitreella phatthalungensis]
MTNFAACCGTLDVLSQGASAASTPSGTLYGGSTATTLTPSTPQEEPMFEPPLPFHCHWDRCDLSFFDALQFDEHLLTTHIKPTDTVLPSCAPPAPPVPTPSLVACEWDHCHKRPASPKALFEHLKQDHVSVSEGHHHLCRWLVADAVSGKITPCGACLPSAEALTKHVTELHIPTRQKSYVCYWDGCTREHRKPFTQRQKILRHLVSHTGDRPFACPYDGCTYRCSDPLVLRQHERTHTGERPCVCGVCGKGFAASTALSVHMRTHTGYKPLVCKWPGCTRRFAESSNLAKHMRVHERAAERERSSSTTTKPLRVKRRRTAGSPCCSDDGCVMQPPPPLTSSSSSSSSSMSGLSEVISGPMIGLQPVPAHLAAHAFTMPVSERPLLEGRVMLPLPRALLTSPTKSEDKKTGSNGAQDNGDVMLPPLLMPTPATL